MKNSIDWKNTVRLLKHVLDSASISVKKRPEWRRNREVRIQLGKLSLQHENQDFCGVTMRQLGLFDKCPVQRVAPDTMAGDTELERTINAYLTNQFVLSKDVPADECLSEAREVLRLVRQHMRSLMDEVNHGD